MVKLSGQTKRVTVKEKRDGKVFPFGQRTDGAVSTAWSIL